MTGTLAWDSLLATYTISDSKNSNNQFTISVSIRNRSTNTSYSMTGFKINVDGGNDQYLAYTAGLLHPGETSSGSGTFTGGTGASSDSSVRISVYSGQQGNHKFETVSGYTVPFTKKTLSISPLEAYMGDSLLISDSAGVGVTSTTHEWSYEQSTGSFSLGDWIIPTEDFERLIPNANSMTVRFTTYSRGNGQSGSSSVDVKLKVPSEFLPTAIHTYEYIDAINDSLVANNSKLRVTLQPGVTPAGNHATITSCELVKVNSSNPLLTKYRFLKSGYVWTTRNALPALSGSPSYTFSLQFRIIDSRGNVLDYTTGQFRVTNFIPPNVTITNLKRTSGDKALIELDIISPSAYNVAKLKVGSAAEVDVRNQLVATTSGYKLSYVITNLSASIQYNVVFIYQDRNMSTYGESPYEYSKLLSTMLMPISLHDDGYNMAVSFGEESGSYTQSNVVNFAKDCFIRWICNNNVNIVKAEDVFCPFRVDAIYISVSSSNPSNLWPGTTWVQIKDRFLLAAGDTYLGGNIGGEATHKLTVSEMPAHTHETKFGEYIKYGLSTGNKGVANDNNSGGNSQTEATGSGLAHNNMPPYLVVYVWKRTA